MDSRGIPIVTPATKYSSPRRTPKHTPIRHELPSSPFIIPSIRNEKSLLEMYDSFADACFQSHYNHSVINDDLRYNILDFYKSEICPSDNTPIPSSLPSSPKPINQMNSDFNTFESKVPELQASRKSIFKSSPLQPLEDTTFESDGLEEATPLGSALLENLSTTHSQVAPTVLKGEETPTEAVPMSQKLPTEAQLEDFGSMEISQMEVDDLKVDLDTAMTNSQKLDNTESIVDINTNIEDKSVAQSSTSSPKKETPPTRKRKNRSQPATQPEVRRVTRSQRNLADQSPTNNDRLPSITRERKTKKVVATTEERITRRGSKLEKALKIDVEENVAVEKIEGSESVEEQQGDAIEEQIEKTIEDELIEDVIKEQREEEESESSKLRRAAKLERDRKEINNINESFPTLSRYYEFVERAGRGTFSKVYKAKDLLVDKYMSIDQKYKLDCALGGADSKYVAVKLIFDISSPRRVQDEISCLLMFRSSPCITPLITAFRNEGYTYLVLPYIEFDHFDDFFSDMTMSDVRSYISQLLTGLECVHAKGIMHRDVKPGNFLYSNKTKAGYLADFGLAQSIHFFSRREPNQQPNPQYTQPQDEAGYYVNDSRPNFMANRSGTKGFRAPEVLLKHTNQTTAIDIWAVGVLILIILSGRYPFFEPEDDADGIMELAHLFGMKKLKEFVEFYGRTIQTNIPTIPEEELDIAELCRDINKEKVEKWDNEEYLQAVDLMKNCLQLIHTKRYTATEALNHPFLKNNQ